MHHQQIHELALETLQDKPGSPCYISSFSKACCQVEEQLTDLQCQKYKALAKEWSEMKLPQKMQMQYSYSNESSQVESTNSPPTSMMNKHGPRAIKEFTSSAYNQFGMHVVVLAAFIDAEGDPSMML